MKEGRTFFEQGRTFFERRKDKEAREYWQKYLPQSKGNRKDIALLKSIENYLLAPTFKPNPAKSKCENCTLCGNRDCTDLLCALKSEMEDFANEGNCRV